MSSKTLTARSIFQLLTNEWISTAYNQAPPSDAVHPELCATWPFDLGRASREPSPNSHRSPSSPARCSQAAESMRREAIEIGYKGEARINPFLAASRLLERFGLLGRPLERNLATPGSRYDDHPPGWTRFLHSVAPSDCALGRGRRAPDLPGIRLQRREPVSISLSGMRKAIKNTRCSMSSASSSSRQRTRLSRLPICASTRANSRSTCQGRCGCTSRPPRRCRMSLAGAQTTHAWSACR